jgi:hypothetical protein
VRATLVALVIAFLGIVIFGALWVDEASRDSEDGDDLSPGERPLAVTGVSDPVADRRADQTAVDTSGTELPPQCRNRC